MLNALTKFRQFSNMKATRKVGSTESLSNQGKASNGPLQKETVEISAFDRPPKTNKQKVASLAKLALAVGTGIALAVVSAPAAIGAGLGALVGGGATCAKEKFVQQFSLGLGGLSDEGIMEKTKRNAAIGAGLGAAVGGVVNGQTFLIAGATGAGLAGYGAAKGGQAIGDRLNPLNW